jgi:purine-binding chemotaxis protein CheW
LPLTSVVRVIRAAEVTPLPRAPQIVLGVIDVAGEVVPVLNVRERFRIAPKDIEVADHFILARAGERTVALAIDQAQGLMEAEPAEFVRADAIVPGVEQVHGVVKREDGLVLIHDLARFLALEEASALEEALEEVAAHG